MNRFHFANMLYCTPRDRWPPLSPCLSLSLLYLLSLSLTLIISLITSVSHTLRLCLCTVSSICIPFSLSTLTFPSYLSPPPPLSLQGAKLMIYQKEFTIADCDTATKELLEEYGKPFGDPLAFPDNLYDPRIINM